VLSASLPDLEHAAKDPRVFNIAGALPFTLAPAIAPAVVAVGAGSYAVLYSVAGFCAVLGVFAILPVKGVRCVTRRLPTLGARPGAAPVAEPLLIVRMPSWSDVLRSLGSGRS
jgi:hypothetical protein